MRYTGLHLVASHAAIPFNALEVDFSCSTLQEDNHVDNQVPSNFQVIGGIMRTPEELIPSNVGFFLTGLLGLIINIQARLSLKETVFFMLGLLSIVVS